MTVIVVVEDDAIHRAVRQCFSANVDYGADDDEASTYAHNRARVFEQLGLSEQGFCKQ